MSLIAVMLVVFLAANLLTSDETKELAATVLSPIVAVTGAALGFYFGGHRTGGLALPEPSSGETS